MASNALMNILVGLGIDPPQNIDPVKEGPFTFEGVLPDNGTTPVSLVAAAAITSKNLQSLGGLNNNPEILILATAFELRLHTAAEADPADLELLKRYTYINHQPSGGAPYYFEIGPMAGSMLSRGVGALAAGASTGGYFADGRVLVPTVPRLIDLNVDTFEIAPETAVDTGATVPFTLQVYGFAWPRSKGQLQPVSCTDEKQAVELRKARQGAKTRISLQLQR